MLGETIQALIRDFDQSFDRRDTRMSLLVRCSIILLCGTYDTLLCLGFPSPDIRGSNKIYLLSLQYPTDDNFSKNVMDVWRWKDAVLGDGRDFFVPRPKTLRSLQRHITENAPTVHECVVLSNCARFELLISTSELPIELLSTLLLHQVVAYEKRQFQPPIDWPQSIVSACDVDGNTISNDTTVALTKAWNVLVGPAAVLEHLCLVAAGMALRPSRPGRSTEFRPFSSRDAHVLLQLRRTLDIVEGRTSSLLLKSAIRAGKAVRNPNICPEIRELRNGASITTAQRIAASVKETTIDCIVAETVTALDVPRAERIKQLRKAALDVASSDVQRVLVRRRLHEPTVALRNGEHVNETEFLSALLVEIEDHR